MSKSLPIILPAFLFLLSQSNPSHAHGIILPPDRIPVTGSYSIKSVTIDATVRDQVAQVQLSQVFRNNSSRDMEVTYVFPVPPDAVITQFTLMIDGRELPAKLLSKEEARRLYESIVRTKRDPAILEYLDHGALQTGIFPLPPNGERKISLRYSQLCKRQREVTDLLIPLAPAKLSTKPIEHLQVTARIDSKDRIKSVYSPSYAINVQRPTDHSATVSYSQYNSVPSDDLRIFWSLSEQPIGASVLSFRPNIGEDGYFLLLASPEVKADDVRIARKSVVFVLDKSGSMAGKKIEQARNALKFMLNNLRESDTFNIVVYDDQVQTFKPELQNFNDQNRADALRYVDTIHDGGSTNIDAALRRGLEMLSDPGRPGYVVFLTDGLPTAGEQNPARIAENARSANRGRARLFCFGVGFDVNARLLDQLATENSGTSDYVRPNEDLEAALSKFYSKMTAPVLTNVRIELAGADVNRIYPRITPDLFAGSQLVLVGRYRSPGETKIRITGNVGDRQQTFEFPVSLADQSRDESYGFVEKLWATRRVGEIINDLDLKGKNQELLDELVRLSTKHGILTPYTAFLADERTNLHALSANSERAAEEAFNAPQGLAANDTGAAGVNLRLSKSEMQQQAVSQQGQSRYLAADGKYKIELGCQVVGNKALYRRSGRWVDPSVTEADEKNAEKIEQFSDRYFELARTNAELRKYFSLPEGCVVKTNNQIYRVDPVKGG